MEHMPFENPQSTGGDTPVYIVIPEPADSGQHQFSEGGTALSIVIHEIIPYACKTASVRDSERFEGGTATSIGMHEIIPHTLKTAGIRDSERSEGGTATSIGIHERNPHACKTASVRDSERSEGGTAISIVIHEIISHCPSQKRLLGNGDTSYICCIPKRGCHIIIA
jgi:hypothetical protein